jgi:hypothetical protein
VAAAVFSGNFCVRKRLPPRIARDNIHAPQPRRKKIQRSSVVERSAVNRLVVGSNPTAGANFARRLWLLIRLGWSVDSNPTGGANLLDTNQNLHTAVDDVPSE